MSPSHCTARADRLAATPTFLPRKSAEPDAPRLTHLHPLSRSLVLFGPGDRVSRRALIAQRRARATAPALGFSRQQSEQRALTGDAQLVKHRSQLVGNGANRLATPVRDFSVRKPVDDVDQDLELRCRQAAADLAIGAFDGEQGLRLAG